MRPSEQVGMRARRNEMRLRQELPDDERAVIEWHSRESLAAKAMEHNADLLFSRVVLPGCPPDVANRQCLTRAEGDKGPYHEYSLSKQQEQFI
jgi:hypothetical protein